MQKTLTLVGERCGTHPVVRPGFSSLGRLVGKPGCWSRGIALQQVKTLGRQNSVFGLTSGAPHVHHRYKTTTTTIIVNPRPM